MADQNRLNSNLVEFRMNCRYIISLKVIILFIILGEKEAFYNKLLDSKAKISELERSLNANTEAKEVRVIIMRIHAA